MSTIPTSSISFRPPGAPATSNIDSGPNAGNVLDGRGSDFLNPDSVLDTSSNFAGSITPITSRTSQSIFGTNFFGSNPDPLKILSATRSGISGALNFNLSFNPTNINPLGWVNPSPTDIILGSLNGQNSIFNGSPIFNPIPSFPSFPIPQSPLPQSPFPTGGFTPPSIFTPGFSGSSSQRSQTNGIPVALIPMIRPVPVPVPVPVAIASPAQQQQNPMGMYSAPQQNPMAMMMQTSLYGLFQMPARPAQSMPVQPYNQQADLMMSLMLQSGELLSTMLRQLINSSQISGNAGNSGNSGSAGSSYQPYQYY